MSFSDNIQLEVEQTKKEMNSKASAIEEVRYKFAGQKVNKLMLILFFFVLGYE